MEEAIALLQGEVRSQRLWDVTLALAEQTLLCAGLASTVELAREQVLAAWQSGAALQRFAQMITALGGPADLVERPDNYLPAAPVVMPVYAAHEGVVQRIDTRAVGIAVVSLGGGRSGPQDSIDPAVGLSQLTFVGEAVGPNRPLAMIHARNLAQAELAAAAVQAAYVVDSAACEASALVSGLCLEAV